MKEIQIPDDVATSPCPYCGHSIVVRDALQIATGPSISNLLGLARTASLGGNLAEAESYYTRVLELDPTITEAWIGKGKAAGWQSSIVNLRLGEVLTSFAHAIGTTVTSDKAEAVQSCLLEVNKIVSALYGMAHKHMLEFVALPNTWTNYLAQVGQMISALESANTWMPTDRTTLENIIHLCSDNIGGVKYRDQFDNNTSKTWFLSPQYETQIRQKLDAAVRALKAIDPTYSPKDVRAPKPDACFVVTATMGNELHPVVQLMRQFRDEWILSRPGGAAFVAWYYCHGPAAAKFIRGRPWVRTLAFVVVVAPAASVARRLLHKPS